MKVEWRLLAGLGAFLLPWTVLYTVASYEWAGVAMMAGVVLAFLFAGGWLFVQARRTGDRPEDRTEARPEEGEGDLGYFPTASVWPFLLGVGAMFMGFGLVFSRWVALPGVLLLATAVAGYARDAQTRP